ncbi:hypothetical protein BH24ACI3_BH24ACI3_03320 [soil metagenome]
MLTDGWLGRYKIIKKIGTGGMGEVFLAEDTKLNRRLAIKTLPANVAVESDRMHRFVLEAKTASGLNHPNIITIYEINDEYEAPFIAMEYVQGETISKLLKGQPLELWQTMDIAIQVSGALAAAHEANVVHRDVKPDNIIVRPDGLVKVLDFGLAKLTENEASSDPEAETIAHRTNPGMILGTASYMSPEQARALEIDGRSDIFSLGTVLYQMLTGRMPFYGENYVDVIGMILHKEPIPITELSPEVPHSVEALVRKCLRKNRDERFQTVRELLADLKDLRTELSLEIGSGQRNGFSDPGRIRTNGDSLSRPLSTGAHSHIATNSISQIIFSEVREHPLRSFLGLAVMFGVILIAGIASNTISWPATSAEAFQNMRFAKVTSTGNVATERVALSPDGKYVAYVVSEAGQESLWVKQAETETLLQTVPPSPVKFLGLSFTRDGNHVNFITKQSSEPAILFRIPVLGGTPRKVLTNATGSIEFSPDGSRISFVRDEIHLFIARSDGTGERKLSTGENGDRYLLSTWSPDSSKLMAAVFSPVDSFCHLVEIDTDTGEQKRTPTPPFLRISGIGWLPEGDGIAVAGRDLETQLSQVWFVSYPGGEPRRITNDLMSYQGLSVSYNGMTMGSVQQNRVANIWTADAAGKAAESRLTTEIGRDEGMSGVAWASDGTIVYTVREKGTQDIWSISSDGTNRRRLTLDSKNNSIANFSPAVTPDGGHIVFVSTRSGNPDLWRMNINGEQEVQLTSHEGIEGEPQISPDGRWVIYDLTDMANNTTIWRVSINGGDPVQLTELADHARRPRLSPDGTKFVCIYGESPEAPAAKLAILPVDGGEPLQFVNSQSILTSRNIRWSADGRSLFYIAGMNKIDNIWSLDLASGEAKQVTNFVSDRIYRFDLFPGSDTIVMSRGSETSDVVLISNFR